VLVYGSVLEQLETLLRKRGDLDDNEKLTSAGPLGETSWEATGDIDDSLDWTRFWAGHKEPTGYVSLFQACEDLLNSAFPTKPEARNCASWALEKLNRFKNSSSPLYRKNLDVFTWMSRYDMGQYRFLFSLAEKIFGRRRRGALLRNVWTNIGSSRRRAHRLD